MKKEHLDNAEEVFYNINMSFNTQQKKIKIIAQALAKAERKGRKATIEEIEKFVNISKEYVVVNAGVYLSMDEIIKKLQEMRK